MSHEDKAIMSTFIGVLAGLVVIAVLFYAVAAIVTSDIVDEDHDGRVQAKIEENIRPVGQVNVGAVPAAPASAAAGAAAAPRPGDEVYNSACLACHASGVAGAPKVGDQAAWSARASKGVDGLLSTAISGIKGMPARGACANCSDEELQAAIEYMLSQSGF